MKAQLLNLLKFSLEALLIFWYPMMGIAVFVIVKNAIGLESIAWLGASAVLVSLIRRIGRPNE